MLYLEIIFKNIVLDCVAKNTPIPPFWQSLRTATGIALTVHRF